MDMRMIVWPSIDDFQRSWKTYDLRKVVQAVYNPQLETFLRVADAGSFNKAAEEAYITPTAVIKQINLLENSLDVKLFERTHRGLILTKYYQSLYNKLIFHFSIKIKEVSV